MSVLAHAGDDYTAFCDGVRRLCEVDLTQYKRGQMERRIRSFATKRGIPALGEYLELLSRRPGELDEFLDRVTINVSQLWRNPEQWELLRGAVLPELAAGGRAIRAWSAGCSYGAEAYTLAAVCSDAVSRIAVSIEGTDIDRRMVERARAGRFSAEDARSAPREPLQRWFEPDGDEWVAGDALRRLVRFDVGDLLRMRFRRQAYDLVLCRNTVIYFNEDVTAALHRRLGDSLRPGGYLVIGATERVREPAALGLDPVHPFTYRKA